MLDRQDSEGSRLATLEEITIPEGMMDEDEDPDADEDADEDEED